KFVAGRTPENMSRLYTIESLFTLTGASSDHRLRVAASLIGPIAAAISGQAGGQSAATPAGVDAKWISECAKDLVAAGQNALVVAGQRQPLEVHLLAYAINSALGAVGNTVTLCRAPEIPEGDFGKANPDTIIVLGGNPVYCFNKTLAAKGRTIV